MLKRLDYIVLSDYLIRGYTATSERKEPLEEGVAEYYYTLLDFADKFGTPVSEIDAANFGNVRIWKVIK
jgi:hypothetical protein